MEQAEENINAKKSVGTFIKKDRAQARSAKSMANKNT